MKLIYHENELLPKLAWCAVIHKGATEIKVYHGKGIEVKKNFFVEGAWDGEFTLGDFHKSTFFMGSGGKILNNETIIFSTPHHAHERLYSITDDDILFISNSLPFLLYMTDLNLDPKYKGYEMDLNTILKGINSYKKYIPLNKNKKVRFHYYCDIFVNENIDVTEQNKNQIGPFKNYKNYIDRLQETLKLFVSNAQSSNRKHQYGLITTISKGYDAAACAALAKDVGCDDVISFNKPIKYYEDCGYDIALELGYKNIILKDAEEYLNNKTLVEAEFVSSGELGNGIVFSAFEEQFSGKMVFIGERGDQLWDKNKTNSNKELQFEGANVNSSMIENRLRVGYIFLPISLFGISEWPSIHSISNSNEMQLFSVGGSYDRPIPRRILETKGIGRKMFGMNKKGAGFNYKYDNLSRIKKRMSKKSYLSFYKYYKENKVNNLCSIIHYIKYFSYNSPHFVNYLFKIIKSPYRIKAKAYDDAVSNPGAPSFLFKWGIQEMIKKYQVSEIKRTWLE